MYDYYAAFRNTAFSSTVALYLIGVPNMQYDDVRLDSVKAVKIAPPTPTVSENYNAMPLTFILKMSCLTLSSLSI